MKLDKSFYLNPDVVAVAKQLIGKSLHTSLNGKHSSGIIVESEAYSYKEKACHAFNNKRTKRTETMFQEGGKAYIYLCYGIHHLFNIVTNIKNKPEAVLIRAIQPIETAPKKCTSGPGNLSKYLAITTSLNGVSLTGNKIWLEEGNQLPCEVSKRIGIDYAQEDALLPWRFTAKDNQWISK